MAGKGNIKKIAEQTGKVRSAILYISPFIKNALSYAQISPTVKPLVKGSVGSST